MNYPLSTPIKKGVYVPQETRWTPVPPPTSNQNQMHRSITWLHHKPQNHAIFPLQPESGRTKQR